MKMFYIWITIRCNFASLSIDIFLFFTRYFLRYLSLKLYISSIKFLWYKVYGIRFRSDIICSSYWITAIVLWAKPFACGKLNKRDYKLLSRCFFHLFVSLYSLNLKFGRPLWGERRVCMYSYTSEWSHGCRGKTNTTHSSTCLFGSMPKLFMAHRR